jgi:CheY-like chemotaxis protein
MPHMASKVILVVDSDPVFRTSLSDILNRAGYNAHAASDGRSAISIAESLGTKDVDLMIVDMALPGISGGALIDAIAAKAKVDRQSHRVKFGVFRKWR